MRVTWMRPCAYSTPATDGSFIVAIFGSEGLFAFDKEGKLVWKKSLGPMDAGYFAVPSAQWGFGSSPIIHDGKVIVLCDVQTNSFLASFDLKTGNEYWRTPRSDAPTWGTPTIFQNMIVTNGPTVRGYEIYKRLTCGRLGTIPDNVDTDMAPGSPTTSRDTMGSSV